MNLNMWCSFICIVVNWKNRFRSKFHSLEWIDKAAIAFDLSRFCEWLIGLWSGASHMRIHVSVKIILKKSVFWMDVIWVFCMNWLRKHIRTSNGHRGGNASFAITKKSPPLPLRSYFLHIRRFFVSFSHLLIQWRCCKIVHFDGPAIVIIKVFKIILIKSFS